MFVCSTYDYIIIKGPSWFTCFVYHVIVAASRFLSKPAQVCYQLTRAANHYDVNTTGHLRTQQRHYTDDVSGWRVMLQADNTWGHMVRTPCTLLVYVKR